MVPYLFFVQLNKPRIREYRTASVITGPLVSNRHAPNALPSPHWFPTAEDHQPSLHIESWNIQERSTQCRLGLAPRIFLKDLLDLLGKLV
jgi:hypothetical protein